MMQRAKKHPDVQTTCDFCGKTITKRYSNYKLAQNHYCDQDCWLAYDRARRLKERQKKRA